MTDAVDEPCVNQSNDEQGTFTPSHELDQEAT